MTKITYIPGEIANAAIDEHGNRKPVTRTQHIFDDAKDKNQAEVNAEVDDTFAFHQSEINALNSQNYVTVDSFSSLPATGAVDTVYRVSNWDGTQQDPSVYSEYAWNGEDYVHLSTKTQIGEVFDISAYHATGGELAKYADLAAALGTNGANIPDTLRKGGMSVKFVHSVDNKYVQYRLKSETFNTTPANWQGVDDEPTAGSDNLVTSGGTFRCIRDSINGHQIYLNSFKQSVLILANGNLTSWENTMGSIVVDVSAYIGQTIKFNYSNALSSSYALVMFYNVDNYSECSSATKVGDGIIGSIDKGDTVIVPESAKLMICFGFQPDSYESNFPVYVIAPIINSLNEDVKELKTNVEELNNAVDEIEADINGEQVYLNSFKQSVLILANGNLTTWGETMGTIVVNVSKYVGNTIEFNYNNALTSSYAFVMFYSTEVYAECSSATKVGEGIIGSISKGDTVVVPNTAKLMLCFGFEPETYETNFLTWVIAPVLNSLEHDVEALKEDVATIHSIVGDKIINCWGDSLTAAGVYENYIHNVFGNYVVNNFGVSGEGTYKILARQGGIQCYLANDITIASGAGSITIPNINVIKEDGTTLSMQLAATANVFPIEIRGIKINSDGSIINSPSNSITIYSGTPVVLNCMKSAKKSKATVFWIGTNGLLGDCPKTNADVDEIIALIKKAIKWECPKIYCVLGIYSADTRFPDECRDYMDEQMRSAFENNFIDVRYNLCKYGLSDAGITPTEQDLIDLSTNDVPTSLRSDNLHLNTIGYNLVGKMICDSLNVQGLVP